MKTRDSRKQKLYEAEFDLRRTVDPIVFATAGEMYAYITKLIRSAWFRRRWPNVSIPSVVLGRGSHYVWGQIVIAQ